LADSRLTQWNQVRILPSVPMEQAMRELQETASLF